MEKDRIDLNKEETLPTEEKASNEDKAEIVREEPKLNTDEDKKLTSNNDLKPDEIIASQISDEEEIDDCKSNKRRLTIVEKLMMIISAFVALPIGFTIYCVTNSQGIDFNYFFENTQGIIALVGFIVILFLLILMEFSMKNYALYKGVVLSTFVSAAFSSLFFLSFATLIGVSYNASAPWTIICSISVGLYVGALLVVRIICFILDKRQEKQIIIVGPKEDAIKLARKIIAKRDKKKKVKYIFYVDGNNHVNKLLFEKFKKANTVILLDTLKIKAKEALLLYFNSSFDKDVYICSTYFDIIQVSPMIKNIAGYLAFGQKPLRIDVIEGFVKRLVDIILSLVLLILTLPVWIILPILIKIDSNGPVFYRQIRYTIDMKEFKIFKFRSMTRFADPNKPAEKDDVRVTRIGKIIRATRLDEIPQVLNVLKGDMSFVGPRALMKSEVQEFIDIEPEYRYRFNVKAGITGLQQVRTSPGSDFRLKLRYDLMYISNYSILLDFRILFSTVKTVLKRSMSDGIVHDDEFFKDFLHRYGKDCLIHQEYIRIFNHRRDDLYETTMIDTYDDKSLYR